jgi:hypothetical protein
MSSGGHMELVGHPEHISGKTRFKYYVISMLFVFLAYMFKSCTAKSPSCLQFTNSQHTQAHFSSGLGVLPMPRVAV